MNILYIFFFVLSKMHLQIKLKGNKHVYIVLNKYSQTNNMSDVIFCKQKLIPHPATPPSPSLIKFIRLYLLQR